MAGFGHFAGGVASTLPGVTDISVMQNDRAKIALANRSQQLEETTARQGRISDAMKITRDEIDGLIKAASDAKAAGATPERLAPLRRLIEVKGAELGMNIPGLPQTSGVPAPGAEPLVTSGLQRFDAIVGATPGKENEPAFPGTGFDAATANIATEIAGKAQRGEPITADDKRAYSIAYSKLSEPRVVGSPETGFSIITPKIDPALFPPPDALGLPPAGEVSRATDGTAIGLADMREAIASIESRGSGDYIARGPITRSGDRAYGRYQVMGANIPSWTREALGRSMTPEQFVADPRAQDAVFDFKFGQFLRQTGSPEDAASIWFTGKVAAEGANRRDVTGTSGSEYVDRFRRSLGGNAPSPTGASPPASGTGGFTISDLTQRRENANESGRLALITQGAKTIQTVRDSIVNPDGSVNRDTIAAMNFSLPLPGLTSGFPGTEGRTVRAQLEDALAAKLRLETGAAANATELQNIIDRFSPSLFDNDSTVKDKLDRLIAFFGQTLTTSDPELAEALLQRSAEEGKAPAPPDDEPEAEFRGFRADGLAVFRRPDGSHFGVMAPDGR